MTVWQYIKIITIHADDGSEEHTAKNSLSNKSQPRDHNAIETTARAINLPYQEDADDYDTLESAQENS